MRLWIGRTLSALGVFFMIFDAVVKLMKIGPVVDSFTHLGYPPSLAPAIGTIALACIALYVIPRTAVVGAILLTGYLGGAVASQVRIGEPLLGFVFFPLYVAAFLWGGLLLRDRRVRVLLQAP